MKKFIAIGSVSLGLIFGVAMAHADDTANSNTTSADTTTTTTTNPSNGNMDNAYHVDNQQAGTQGNDTTSTTTTPNESSTATTSQSTTVAKTKSCTDDAGNTYQHGQKGYKSCMKAMKKKQMGGTMGSDTGSMGNSDLNHGQ